MGRNDAADPNAEAWAGDTHGPAGLNHAVHAALDAAEGRGMAPRTHGRSPHTRTGHAPASTLPRRATQKAPAKTVKPVELNIVGIFASPWKGKSSKQILDAAQSEDWFPSEENVEFARSGSKGDIWREGDIYTLFYKLGKLARKSPKSIHTLNIFTHGDKGYVGLSGRVTFEPKLNPGFRGNVYLDGGHAEFSKDLIEDILYEESRTVFRTKSMTEDAAYKENVTLEDVRGAFASDAEVVIYACHAGLDQQYLARMANLLGARVTGFKKM
ncbi:MAG TPA: hypothetical protein VHV81_01850, partial [Steroidobacteraceae bacterium]|nr:hypothetical protein [Steroidobacteraceae bacterium]